MPDGVTSVGAVSLDLTIKSQLRSQLAKIAQETKQQMSAPVRKIGEDLSAGATKAFESVKSNIQSVGDAVATDVRKVTSELKKASEDAAKVSSETETHKTEMPVTQAKYDTAEIERQVEEFASQLGKAANKEIGGITEEMRKQIGKFEISADPVEKLRQHLENTREKISLVQAKWQELQYALGKEETDQGAAKLVERLNALEKELIRLSDSASKTENQIANIGAPADEVTTKCSRLQGMFSSLGPSMRSVFEKGSGIIKSFGSKAVNGLKNQFAKLKGSVSGLFKPLEKLKKAVTSALRSVTLMAGLYAAFRGIRSAVQQACNSNDDFKKSLNEIKTNLSVAFQPIMTAVMPAINSLMSGLSKATQIFAEFTAEIFGSTYKEQLDAVKKMKSNAKEAEKTSKYLAGFDVMNVASDTSDNSSSEESDVDLSAIEGKDVKLPNWADRMKAAIKDGDWAGVGSLLAESINKVFNIDWKAIQKKVNRAVSNITSGLNGLISDLDWAGMGETVAGGINTIIGAAHTFVTNFNWSGLGKSLGTGLNSLVKNFDAKKAAETISGYIKGLLETAISFLQTTNWQQIGEKAAEFVSSIDWSGLVSRLAEGIGSALGGIAATIWGFIKGAWDNVVKWWYDNAVKDGKFTVSGLLNGIIAGVKNIGNWIKEHIFQPFINGFKKVFKINSPSKVMEELGKYIIQGLINGVKSLVSSVKSVFKSVLVSIRSVFSGIQTWFQKNVYAKIKAAIIGIPTEFRSVFSSAWSNAKSSFVNAASWAQSVMNKIKKPFKNIATWFKDKFTSAWTAVKNVFSEGGEVFTGIKDGILNGLKSVVNTLIGGINKVIAVTFNGLNKALKKIKDVSIVGIKPFDWIKTLDVPQIPKLARGGLATAPTLAMVGDNKSANVDPEVIAPLSKLGQYLEGKGNSKEILEMLKRIIELLENMQICFHGDINEGVLFRAIVRLNREYKKRTGVSAL